MISTSSRSARNSDCGQSRACRTPSPLPSRNWNPSRSSKLRPSWESFLKLDSCNRSSLQAGPAGARAPYYSLLLLLTAKRLWTLIAMAVVPGGAGVARPRGRGRHGRLHPGCRADRDQPLLHRDATHPLGCGEPQVRRLTRGSGRGHLGGACFRLHAARRRSIVAPRPWDSVVRF